MRAVAQAVSYEVFIRLVLISPIILLGYRNRQSLRDNLMINVILMTDVMIL